MIFSPIQVELSRIPTSLHQLESYELSKEEKSVHSPGIPSRRPLYGDISSCLRLGRRRLSTLKVSGSEIHHSILKGRIKLL